MAEPHFGNLSMLDANIESAHRAAAANSGTLGARPQVSNYVAPQPAPMIGAGPAPAPQTAAQKLAAQVPTFTRMVRGADGILRQVGSFAAKAAGPAADALGRVGGAIQTGVGAYQATQGNYGAAADNVFMGVATAANPVIGVAGNVLAAGRDAIMRPVINSIYGTNRTFIAQDGTPAAPSTIAPAAPSTPAPMGYGAGMQAQVRAGDNAISGDGVTPTNAPWTTATAENIRGRGIPADGTGGFINNRTGAVTTLDSRDGGGGGVSFGANPAAYAPTVYRSPGRYDPPAGAPPGWTPREARAPVAMLEPQYGPGSVASGVGATLRMRQAMADNARGAADRKLFVDSIGKNATAAAAEAKADQDRFQTRAGREHYSKTGNAAEAAAVAAGRYQRPTFQAPPTMQPLPGESKPGVNFNTGTGEFTNVPIRTQQRGGLGTDGKYYKQDSAGKLVEMTASEKGAFLAAQRTGFGATR